MVMLERPRGRSTAGGDAPRVLWLDDPAATRPEWTGGKGAALAVARNAGLPVLPGFTLTTAATEHGHTTWSDDDVRAAWAQLSEGGRRPLVVRSSSVAEDQADSSMAGQFASVVGVEGWERFLDAVTEVVRSRRQERGGRRADVEHPLAVLVQPLLDAKSGGVLFGLDPVTGREDRLVVAAAPGAPERLVSGEVSGTRYELARDGAVQEVDEGPEGGVLTPFEIRALVELAEAARQTFDGPQDVEWAFGTDGTLWLLQSRPVTTPRAGVPVGPVLGPGPVAETFPDAVSRLEEDLWVVPLRRALQEAFRLAGVAPSRRLETSPVVVTVAGRVAVDLEMFGEGGERGSRWKEMLDPRPKLRRLRVAARVGRLRGALPGLAEDLVEHTDALLLEVGDLGALSTRQLIALLDRTGDALVTLHAHEVLLGLLVQPGAPRLTGTSVALRVLADARRRGLSDDEILARHPVVLALTPPRVQAAPALPAEADAPPWSPPAGGDHVATLREALRLRVRWVQELSARGAWQLAERLSREGLLEQPEDARHLRLQGLQMTALGRAVPLRVPPPPEGDPLPARFRLTTTGDVVPVRSPRGDGGGTGASAGQGIGPVHSGDGVPPEGSVLVVRTLDPQLAAVLPRLAGLVAETGSVLSHAAILARESGVPTVVGVDGALERFPKGSEVRVDGDSGEVELVHSAEVSGS